MPRTYSHVRRALCRHPWAIHTDGLSLMVEIVERRIAGDPLTADERLARIEARRAEIAAARARSVAPMGTGGAIAVLPLYSVICNRMYLLDDVSASGTSAEGFGKAFSAAMRDPQVGAIVIDGDTPGGSVHGIAECGDLIYQARGVKPVVAVASAWLASAGYHIGSQAEELVVTPSGEVGSIGVIALHEDISGAVEQAGVKITLVSAGRYKTEGNPFEALGDEAREQLQREVDRYYEMFVAAVVRGRKGKASPKAVRGEQFGEGRMVGAADAVNAGMADSVETLDEVIHRLASRLAKGGGRGSRSGARASVADLDSAAVSSLASAEAVDALAAAVETTPATAAAAEPCATCDHDRADHPDDGQCQVDGCECEAFAEGASDEERTGGTPAATEARRVALARLQLAEAEAAAR